MQFGEILLLIVLGLGAWFWLGTLRAREAGVRAARAACEREGVQLLDETVAGRSVRPARDARVDGMRRRLRPIPGMVPSLAALPHGCSFADRCSHVLEKCRAEPPALLPVDPGHVSRCWRAGEF